MLFLFWVVLCLGNPVIDSLKYIFIIYMLYSTWGDLKNFRKKSPTVFSLGDEFVTKLLTAMFSD